MSQERYKPFTTPSHRLFPWHYPQDIPHTLNGSLVYLIPGDGLWKGGWRVGTIVNARTWDSLRSWEHGVAGPSLFEAGVQ